VVSIEEGALVLLGSASGIGGVVAEHYAATFPDAPVWVTYAHDQEGAEALCARIGRGTAVRVDARSDEDFAGLAAGIREAGQKVRAVVHGMVEVRPVDLIGHAAEVVSSLEVSAISLIRAVGALDDLLEEGSVVSYLSSVGGTTVTRRYGPLGIGKAAGDAVVRYLALELGRRGIRLNSVGCGPIPTKAFGNVVGSTEAAEAAAEAAAKRTLVKPAPSAPEVAELIVALTGDATRALTGQYISADGGLSLRM
jgi:enoyl-[acyl-carrier-protein] reductase (NADH)